MNTTEQPPAGRERELFIKALEKSTPAERAAFLDGACGNDAALRSRVMALVERFDQIGTFLEQPVVRVQASASSGGQAPDRVEVQASACPPSAEPSPQPTAPSAAQAGLTSIFAPITEQPGSIIGRYKLLQTIGEGGCGVVYMAEQSEPVRRRVALKVIKLGMDTKSVIARFEAERQALALTDHPNIAKVLDGGATEAGRPYFVMELVRGVKITEYCDQNNLSTRDRLDLFIKVCQAVQHAHQKGIIHRDIKPSNILVTLHDGVPVPKVIDFGIAKATTDQRLTDKTLFTALEQFIGTPAYMSPEQAEMSGLDIDTRCDIYSLGVLLYELLTGKTPFDAKELLASGLDEMRRTIREQEPVRPSTKLSQTLVAANVSSLKSSVAKPATEEEVRADSRRLLRLKETIALLRGDVDWIVMKCLEKDRARRYETANGLAADLKRHLNNEPVVARPPSAAYRFQKLVRRNKLAFAAASAVTLTLLAGLSFSTWSFLREAAQRRTAENNAQLARQAEQKAESARAEADKATSLAQQRATEMTRNLYFAEMNLAGQAAVEPGGMGRIDGLSEKWLPKKEAADQRGWEWHYLRSLLHQDLFTLSEHTNGVNSVSWCPDGKRMASGSGDDTIKIWDAVSRREIRSLIGHTKGVNSVAWSPDGQRLVSGGSDNVVKIWDTEGGHLIRMLPGHTSAVKSVSWSPDGTRLASGSTDNTIKVWDANSGTHILTLTNHTAAVNSVSWSPDGKRLASGSADFTLKVWDADGGQVIHSLTGHTAHVSSVAWSFDGKRLASAGWDHAIKLWDADSGRETLRLHGHISFVISVAWSPDGKRLGSASTDNTVRFWNTANGTNSSTRRGHTKGVSSVAWSPDGKRLASGSADHRIKVWDPDGEETLTLRGHTDHISSVAWSPDGRHLVSASTDNTLKIWDTASRQAILTTDGHTKELRGVHSVAMSPDGKRLASASWDKLVKVWDAGSGTNIFSLPGHHDAAFTVAWSPDGKRLASASFDSTVKVWEVESGQAVLTFRGHDFAVFAVAWSPDGKRLASGSMDNTVKVWDAESGLVIRNLTGHAATVYAVAWSPDGKHLVSGSADNTGKVWETATGTNTFTLHGHTDIMNSAAWSPDGSRIASSSWDNTVRIWDPASGQETLTLRGHTANVRWVAWSPDGKRLASAGWDHTIKIWDAGIGYTSERE